MIQQAFNPLGGPAVPLQGSNPGLQGAPAPFGPVAVKPIAQPIKAQPVSYKAPTPSIAQTNLSTRYANQNGTIIDKVTGQGFATPAEFFAASGQKSFNGLVFDTGYQVPQAAPVQSYSQPAPAQAPAQLAPEQQFAQQAGQAGLSLDDFLKLSSGSVSQAEKDAIRAGLGIDKLEQSVFSRPSQSTEQLFSSAYSAAGLADIKAKYAALNDEISRSRADYAAVQGKVNENPFLSETSRQGRLKNAGDLFEQQINNKINQQSQLGALYSQGLNEVSGLVGRQSADYQAGKQLDTQNLQYLLSKAEQQTTALQSEKTAKAKRYLPDFLSSLTASKKPETIGSNEAGYFRWNPTTGSFEQVVAPKPKDTSLDDAYKTLQIRKLQQEIAGGGNASELLSPSDAQTLGVPYGTTKGQASQLNIVPQKPATDAQNLAAGYAARVQQSTGIFDKLATDIAAYDTVGFEVQKRLPNSQKSPAIQSYEQAAQNFINAVLRRESGAAIAPSEFDNARKQYLPSPGDSAVTLSQKKANRDLVLQGLQQSAGPAFQTPASANDPMNLRGEMGGGASIAPVVAQKYPDGFNGGQCGTFAHRIVDFPPVGDSKTEKIASVQKYGMPASAWRQNVQVGDVIITGENPTYGHVAVVNAILPDGRVQLSESNYKQSNKVSNDRIISINSSSIYGAIRGTLKIA